MGYEYTLMATDLQSGTRETYKEIIKALPPELLERINTIYKEVLKLGGDLCRAEEGQDRDMARITYQDIVKGRKFGLLRALGEF